MFCEKGHRVTGLEIVSSKRELLAKGELHLYERGLKELLGKHLKERNFILSDRPNLKNRSVCVIAVGTPTNKLGVTDLSQVENVLGSLKEDLASLEVKSEVLVVLRSTVPIGTCESLLLPFLRHELPDSLDLDFVFYPEFLREGSALDDFNSTESALIACSSPNVLEKWSDFFSVLPGFKTPMEASFKSAEVAKLSFNSFNALRVTYTNELNSIAGAHGVDLEEFNSIQSLLLKNQKSNYLKPGFSYGGHCLKKDLSALIQLGREKKLESSLLKTIHESNEDHYLRYLDFIERLNPKNILISGVTFKPDTDDSRGSFSLRLARDLLETPLYKDQRKIFVLEDDLAFEKALPALKGLNIERYSIEAPKDFDTLILGPKLLEGKVRDELFAKAKNVVDLKYHSYPPLLVSDPFKDSHED